MKRFGRTLVIVLGLAVIGSVVSLVPQKSATAQGGPTVTIGGPLPLPVTGSVGIAGTPTVNVGNTPKPSQLVTLEISLLSSHSCPSGLGDAVNLLLNPDGSRSSFSVGAGQVLIITDAQMSIPPSSLNHPAAGDTVVLSVLRDGGSVATRNVVTAIVGTADSSGNFSTAFTFPTGVAVAAGVAVCSAADDVTTDRLALGDLKVHGYLTTAQ